MTLKPKPTNWLGLFIFLALFVASGFMVGFVAVYFDITFAWLILGAEGLVFFAFLYFTGFIGRKSFKENKKAIATPIVVLVSLVIGMLLVVMVFFAFSVSAVVPPSTHTQIANSIMIKDTSSTTGPILSVKCVDVGNKQWGQGLTTATFQKGSTYPQTSWLWQRFGDTEFVMTIWGPDDSGKVYLLEFGRVGGDPFTISINGVVKFTISAVSSTDWQSGTTIGYYNMVLTLS